MSNYLAVATVTETLRRMLDTALSGIGGASATHVRPDGTGGDLPDPGVNIFLYQVTPNAALRNADLPNLSQNSRLINRPQAAIDLNYLFSFYGDGADLEPQRVLGKVTIALHERSVLTRESIEDTKSNVGYLATSDLNEQIELVKFTPVPLTLEELSKLWSVFFQTAYRLSVVYQGTVVLLESETTPRKALPVRQPLIYVRPFRQPYIEKIISEDGEKVPLEIDSIILIKGQKLRGEVTKIQSTGVEVAPQNENISETEIKFDLTSFPVNTLRAGVTGLQVVHKMMMGKPEVEHSGTASNVAAFVLHPRITAAPANVRPQGGNIYKINININFNLEVGKSQRVVFIMNELSSSDSPQEYSFVSKFRPANSNSITINDKDIKGGNYLVRVQVDGAESILEVDPDPDNPKFIGPKMSIP